jgi:biotin transporter BioY
MWRIALRVALAVAVASLGASVTLWLRIAFSAGDEGSLRVGTLSGLVAATFGVLFGCLIGPTLITVLAARAQMARSRRTAWLVVGVLVAALLGLTLLAMLAVLGSGLFAQGFSLAWPALVVVAAVVVPGAPWFVRPLSRR